MSLPREFRRGLSIASFRREMRENRDAVRRNVQRLGLRTKGKKSDLVAPRNERLNSQIRLLTRCSSVTLDLACGMKQKSHGCRFESCELSPERIVCRKTPETSCCSPRSLVAVVSRERSTTFIDLYGGSTRSHALVRSVRTGTALDAQVQGSQTEKSERLSTDEYHE